MESSSAGAVSPECSADRNDEHPYRADGGLCGRNVKVRLRATDTIGLTARGISQIFGIVSPGYSLVDVADGTDGLDVITANAEALAEHGVLGESWILPPPHSLDRMPLAALYPVS